MSGKIADKVYLNTYRYRARRYLNSKKHAVKKETKIKRKTRKLKITAVSLTKKARSEYGEHVLIDSVDIPDTELQKECQVYLEQNIKNKNPSEIEIATRGQSANNKWIEERKKRLTSSNFGEIMSRNVNNNSSNLVKRMLYSGFKGNKFTIKGLSEEENARIEYTNKRNEHTKCIVKIEQPGLMIDKEHPFLAASCDGIVLEQNGEKGLIEIKTLLQNNKKTITDAAKTDKTFCLHTVNGNVQLKTNHKYFYQVQGMLNILQLDWCDFIVRRINPHDMFIQRILKDSNLWKEIMLPKLTAFYYTHLLPELAVPRHGTVSGIRKPSIPWVGFVKYIYTCI